MKTSTLIPVVLACMLTACLAVPADAFTSQYREVSLLPASLTATQTMRFSVACIARVLSPSQPCQVTLRFLDAEGSVITDALSSDTPTPLELTASVPVRGSVFLDLPGNFVVTGASNHEVVRPVLVGRASDVALNRHAASIEVFDTATGESEVSLPYIPYSNPNIAVVAATQRPDDFTGVVREKPLWMSGITFGQTARLHAACAENTYGGGEPQPCHAVLRFLGANGQIFNEPGPLNPFPDQPISEQEVTIQPGAIATFEFAGSQLGATPTARAMFRTVIVANPDVLARIGASTEIADATTGVAKVLHPSDPVRPQLLDF